MPAQRGIGLLFLVIVAGLVIGSLLGELVGGFLSGWPHDLFTKGPTIGLTSPATVDLRFLSFTFGLALKVNLVGVVGILLAALTLRKI